MKKIRIHITEHDVENFTQLIEDGQSFEWSVDGVKIEFVSTEHRKEEVRNQIKGLKQSMEHAGVGSKDIRLLHALEDELAEMGVFE